MDTRKLSEKQKNFLIHRGLQTMTSKERKLVEYYELQYFFKHYVPTIDEVANHLNYKQVEVNYFLTRRPVIAALDNRGIPWRQHSQDELTSQQVAAAITVMNFVDQRTNEEKLDELGINPQQYYAWLNDPQFRTLVDRLADQNLGNIKPTAIAEFTKLVNKGDWQAIKYYLDVTGAIKNDNVPQSEQLLKIIVEIIQKHVKDPAIIIAIANEIKLASANKTLEVVAGTAKEITSHVIEDQELLDARKQLGV